MNKKFRKRYMYILIMALIVTIIILSILLYNKNKKYAITVENSYNFALYELIDYIKDVENYLAKSLISSSPDSAAESLIKVWREANLGQVYLSQLPVSSTELAKTTKFLNQVSEYSYSLSQKNIVGEELTEEDFKNLQELYNYAIDLKNILNQLIVDMQERKNKLERIVRRKRNSICTTSRQLVCR